ncbi:MAG: LysR family transcriptional regulator [Clostridium butyricum]|nr:LysR family transcriptional regulator [Clostridium butyricum]
MDFKELEYVLSIAKNNSISKAAKELYISQPSLSKYLQNLEKNIDVKLFERCGNNFILTYAGEKYISYAKEILKIKNDMDHELFDILNNTKGRLNIACSIVRSPYIISETLPKFKKMYPDVKVNFIEESNSNNLGKLLISGDADIAIFNYNENNNILDSYLIKEEEIMLAVNSNHPLANEGIKLRGCNLPWIDITKFKNENFVINCSTQKSGEIAQKVFDEMKIQPNVILKTRSVECAVRLAASGFGISFASETHLKHMNLKNAPVYFSIGNPKLTVKLFAVYRKNGYMPQYIHDYIKIVKDVL